MRHIPYSRQTIDENDIRNVVQTLKSDFITQGKHIDQFEYAITRHTGAKFSLVFNSGTSALHCAYFASGLKPKDEIITSPITFAATANAALYLEAKPIFSDIEASTGNIDALLVEKKINKRTKILVPVHYGGFPANLAYLRKIARKHNLLIVEDASQAIGATYLDSKIGSCKFSDITVFSFHAVKHITTGEGGAITTNNKVLYEKMLLFRSHGITKNPKLFVNKSSGDWYHEMQELGFNYRMTDFQAALGSSQIKKLDKFLKRRLEIAKIYNMRFKTNKYFDVQPYDDKNHSSYHLYPLLLKDEYKRNKPKIFAELRRRGLGVQVHYIPVYLHPYYKNLGYKRGQCPVAEDFYEREISIPLFPKMNENDVEYVVNTINKTLSQ